MVIESIEFGKSANSVIISVIRRTMANCNRCGTQTNRIVVNTETLERVCESCAITHYPTFLPYLVYTVEDLQFLKDCGIYVDIPAALEPIVARYVKRNTEQRRNQRRCCSNCLSGTKKGQSRTKWTSVARNRLSRPWIKFSGGASDSSHIDRFYPKNGHIRAEIPWTSPSPADVGCGTQMGQRLIGVHRFAAQTVVCPET